MLRNPSGNDFYFWTAFSALFSPKRQLILFRFQCDAIECQEHAHRRNGRAFIAVNKRMIFNDTQT